VTERERAAREFVGVMGWVFLKNYALTPLGSIHFSVLPDPRGGVEKIIELPAPDAPLHEHLAFVGRVAEELGTRPTIASLDTGGWYVSFPGSPTYHGTAADPSYAAMLAAKVMRRGAKRGGKP